MSEYKKAAILSYVNISIRNVIGIFLTPFIIRMLGNSDYGLYSLIGSFIAYLTILDLGLNATVVRYIAQYRAQDDKKAEGNFVATIFIIYLFISLLIAGFGTVFYFRADNMFSDSLTVEELAKAKTMILILIVNIMIGIPGKAFEGINMGYEKFVFVRGLAIIKYLSRSVMVVAILTLGSDSLGLVVLDTVLNIVFIGVSAYYALVVLKVKPKLIEFKLKFVKELFSYSIWVFIFSLVFQFQWSTGQVALGINANTETVAVFAVGVTLGLYYTTFGNVINGMLLPKAVKSVYNGSDIKTQTNDLLKVSRLTVFILLYILLAFILFGKEFIFLWVGEAYKDSYIVALLIMIAYTLPIAQGYIHSLLEAKKLLKFKSLSLLVFGSLGIITGGILSVEYGSLGMISGIAGFIIFLHLFLNIYYQKKLGINIINYFGRVFIPYILPLLVIFFSIEFLHRLYNEYTWLSFLFKATIYTIIYAIANYLIVFNKDEKEHIHNLLYR